MQTLFYYDIEPNRGYVVGDKLRRRGVPFETGYWERIVGQEITDEWQKMRHSIPLEKESLVPIFEVINAKIREFIATRPQQDPKSKPFYLNFNADGIDCFVSRWNWKENA